MLLYYGNIMYNIVHDGYFSFLLQVMFGAYCRTAASKSFFQSTLGFLNFKNKLIFETLNTCFRKNDKHVLFLIT